MKAIIVALLLVLTSLAFAQRGLTGKVVKIDAPSATITLAAVMGYKDMKLKSPALLDKVKISDVIQFVTVQEGTGVVISEIQVITPAP